MGDPDDPTQEHGTTEDPQGHDAEDPDAAELDDLDVDDEAEDVRGGEPIDGKGNDVFIP